MVWHREVRASITYSLVSDWVDEFTLCDPSGEASPDPSGRIWVSLLLPRSTWDKPPLCGGEESWKHKGKIWFLSIPYWEYMASTWHLMVKKGLWVSIKDKVSWRTTHYNSFHEAIKNCVPEQRFLSCVPRVPFPGFEGRKIVGLPSL